MKTKLMIISFLLGTLFLSGCSSPAVTPTIAAIPATEVPSLPSPSVTPAAPTASPTASLLPPSPTPDAAVAAAAKATLQASSFMEIIAKLKDEGKLSTSDGFYYHLDDVDQSVASRGEYFWIPTDYSPVNFVLRAHAAWQTGDANADWSVSGPGFLFHESGDNRFYAVFLRLNGQVDVYRIDVEHNSFFYVANKKIANIGKPDGKADLMLVVERNSLSFYVDDQLVIDAQDANLSSTDYGSGGIDFAIASGTNKNFGMRVIFSNIELWEIGAPKQSVSTTLATPAPSVTPTPEDTRTKEGIQAFQSGEFVKSISLLDSAIEADPKYSNPDGYITRGRAYYALEQYSKAIADFNQAILFAPAGSKIYLYRGYAYEKMKNNPKALADYSICIQLDPGDVWAYRSRAMIYAAQKKYKEALQDLDQAISLASDSAPTYNNRCWLKYLLKQYTDALPDCDQALSIEADNLSYLESRAFVYKALAQVDKARADFEKILSLTTDKALISRIQAEVKKLKTP